MDLSKTEKKTLQVSRGFTYTYYVSPARNNKPTIALFHGWPDTARLWAGLINDYLIQNGYGIVAVDCLGHGGTSKPNNIDAYSWKDMTADIINILDAEDVDKVVSLGHDWGSVLCQILYNFYSSRVLAVVMINVAYLPPTGNFNLDATNKATREAYGYGIFEYWHFMTSADGPKLMSQNLESVYTMAFSDPNTWLDTFCSPDGMRMFVVKGHTQPTLPFATTEQKEDFMARFGHEGSFDAPSCWYKAAISVQNEVDKKVPEDAKTIKVPVLFWGGKQDAPCRPDALSASIEAGLLPDVKSVVTEGGHWALLEKPDEFGKEILSWLQETLH